MKLDRCMSFYVFIVLLLSIGSALISAVIVSSDTINIEQDTNPSATINSDPISEIPIDKSDIKKVEQINDLRTETQSLDKKITSDTTDEQIIQSEPKPEPPKSNIKKEASVEQEQTENLSDHGSEIDGSKKEPDSGNENENEKRNVNAVPNVPASPSITVSEESNDLLVDTPLVADIENILIGKNDSNETQQQFVQELNSSQLPVIMTENAAVDQTDPIPNQNADEIKDDLIASSVEKTSDEVNKTAEVEENQIPVFSEWAQKRLEQVEKEDEQEVVNTSTMKKNTSATNKPQVLKLKSAKNYASPDCGAKIIAANTESSGTGYVLTSTRDEYMLSPCKSRIWFVVELCEAIQAERIDLANYELFSSSPKNFSVAVSSRFPTRDWSNVGRFIAKDERYIQGFDLYPHLFGRYVRVDVHSHYNSEHFCPISLFRVYGTSEFEAFETENRQHPLDDLDEDDEDDQEADSAKGKGNIFQSASDAVMSIVDKVKKAASFVKTNGNKTIKSNEANLSQTHNEQCVTTNYAINCENCSVEMVNEVNAISQCKQQLLNRLLNIEIVRNSLYKSQICANLTGFDLNLNCSEPTTNPSDGKGTSKQLTDLQMEYITHLFSLKYITSMCNLLAANDRKFSWNATVPVNTEPSINITIDKNVGDLLPNAQTKENPPIETAPADGVTQTEKKETDENKVKYNVNEEQTIKEETPGESDFEHLENTDKSKDNNDGVETEAGPSSNAENSEEKLDQNIFNVVQPTEIVTEPVAEPSKIDSIAPTKTDSINKDAEPMTPPSVIILPETPTTTTTPPPPTPSVPATEINDVVDDQAANGWTNTPQFGQKLHSESVFLRLSNRVKALERNMSLSGQYLEELSRRYKKQVEELQSSFAKTLVNIEEQSRKNLERKQELFEQNEKLRNDLEILHERLFSWKNILICCVCFTCVQIVIFHIILKIWGRKYGLERSSSIDVGSMIEKVDDTPRKRKSANVPMKFRRKSTEEKRERNLSESMERRPSTEALNITGTYTELLINDSNSTRNGFSENNHQLSDDSAKNGGSMNEHPADDISGYVRIEDLRNMYEKPESDYEFYGPIAELKSNGGSGSHIEDCGSETTLDSSFENSSSSPQTKKPRSNKNNKNGKNRRLSSPSFFKSPFTSGTAHAQSTGWEWHRSKKSSKSSQLGIKKSKSESPPTLKHNGLNGSGTKSASPVLSKSFNGETNTTTTTHNDSARSSISSSVDGDRKATGSIKRLLKKIF